MTAQKGSFQKYLFGIPQDEYPEDAFDKYVLKGIREIWVGAEIKLHNSLLIFNTELDNLRRQIDSFALEKDFTLQIEPEIDLELLMKFEIFKSLVFRFELYLKNQHMNDYWSNGHVMLPLAMEDWQNLYAEIKSKKLYTNPSELIQL